MTGDSEERVPWQVTRNSASYGTINRLSVSIVLENVRSMYNVGAFFRTADASGATRLYLCGITASPPKHAISKTALGAEEVVPWEYTGDAPGLVSRLRTGGCEIAAIEASLHAVDLFDWQPRFPVASCCSNCCVSIVSSTQADSNFSVLSSAADF